MHCLSIGANDSAMSSGGIERTNFKHKINQDRSKMGTKKSLRYKPQG